MKMLERAMEVGLLLAIVAIVWLLAGCNAVNGLGRDLQQVTAPYAENAGGGK